MNTDSATTETVTSAFHENSQPAAARRFSFAISSGNPPSSVPAGQSHLQNAGVTTPFRIRKYTGSASTNTASTTYLIPVSLRVQTPFLILRVGILCSSSWISPNGHKNAQIARPKSAPNTSSVPSTYIGTAFGKLLNDACKDPSGHEPTAPGQE